MPNYFNLSSLYLDVFGYRGRPIGGGETRAIVALRDDINSEVVPYGVALESVLGTPIHLPCTLDNLRLPNEPLIRISGSKKVVETDFDGQDGTFKEIFSVNDWQIDISGIATNDDKDALPEEFLRKLRDMIDKRGAVKITNDLCLLFGITDLVIYDYDFPAIPGQISAQPYSLMCKSDRAFELEVRDGS